jgi:DNA ligase-1
LLEKFGAVRTIKPEFVFELAFDDLNRSSRRNSGIAVRFSRILRQRTDKTAAQANTLEPGSALLPPE